MQRVFLFLSIYILLQLSYFLSFILSSSCKYGIALPISVLALLMESCAFQVAQPVFKLGSSMF